MEVIEYDISHFMDIMEVIKYGISHLMDIMEVIKYGISHFMDIMEVIKYGISHLMDIMEVIKYGISHLMDIMEVIKYGISHLMDIMEVIKYGISHFMDILKTLHLQATQANKQLQARYNVLSEERVNVERQYQSLCESWRVELEEKQHQFEQARAQILGPRDLELIKVKVIEEIEQPYKNKCEAIAKEAESAQHNFVRQRRDFEELQASYKGLEVRSQTDVEALRSETMATISALKDKLAALGQPTAQLAKVEARNKVLEREKAGLAFDLSKLHEEVDEL
eukprot:gene10798-16947_t